MQPHVSPIPMEHVRPVIRSFVAAVFLLALGAVGSAFAADTGTISGAVFDNSGQPVADAILSLAGEALPVARTTQTDANGSYRFEFLLPGDYGISVSKGAVGSAKRAASVDVGKDTQVDVV